MSLLADTTVNLARVQFATTSIYHFLFVPLTLGLGPIVATFQTLWLRTRDEAWLKLTHFFGTLFLINFAIGVATGLVQEFQFGMNWSVYSKFVGNVFGAPLAIEGLAAFFLESTFLGLWIFGWNRLPARLHLATLYLAVLGSWLSAYFILVANSWMQDPVGYKLVDGEAQLTSVWQLLSNDWALWAFGHTIFAGLTAGAAVVFGVCCWHLARGRSQALFTKAAKVALIVLVPVSLVNLWFGSHFGILVTELQPMKISASEAQWDDCQPCAFSLFQIGGFTQSDQTPSFSIQIPRMLSFLATGSFNGAVTGLNELNRQEEAKHGPGNYEPDGPDDLLEHARDGLRRVARRAGRGRRRVPAPAAAAREVAMVPVARRRHDVPAVRRGGGRVGAHRDGPPALDRAGPAEDGRRELARGRHELGRGQPRRLRLALRRAARPRHLPDAALRRPRAVRARRRRGGSRPAGGELLMDLVTVWFVLVAVLWSGYLMLEGFDFGVGMLLPFLPHDERERSVMLRTIGPVWDGNEVWLVTAGGAMFAAFPAWYATMFSGFYLALLLVLVFLILRVLSFEWRAKVTSPRWQAVWMWANAGSSFAVSFVWGVALASLLFGVPINSDGDFAGNLSDLFNAYTVTAGVAVVLVFVFHGATFLTLRTTGELCERAAHVARQFSIAAAAVGAVFLVWTVVVAVDHNDKGVFPPALPAALAIAAFLGAVLAVHTRRSGWAFVATASGVVLVVATLFTSLYPRVMVSSTDFGNSLTVDSASSAHYTLAVMSVVALIFVPLVLAYQGWTYYTFRQRVGGEPEAAEPA